MTERQTMITESEANEILETIGAECGWTRDKTNFPIVVADEPHLLRAGYDGNGRKREATGYELRDGNWWEPADLSSREAFTAQARRYFAAFDRP